MRFETVPTLAADGAILAHSLKTGDRRLRKGRVLSVSDIDALRRAGITEVTVARLENGDMDEDSAAAAIATSFAGAGTSAAAAFTGRANLHAEYDGLVVFDPRDVESANLTDDALTIATLNPFSEVSRGEMIATVKVIPYAAPRTAVETVAALGAASPIKVLPFRPMTAALITTEIEPQKSSVVAKARNTMEGRLRPLGGKIGFETRCEHKPEAVANALRESIAQRAEIHFVLGASAISDREDVIPAGIELAGGTVTHFGMPVDPGNLLLLAKIDGMPVIGLPGCARSPKVNGLDLVLRRLFAGIELKREDIMRMGVGGLLNEIPERPQPRSRSSTGPAAEKASASTPKIAIVILAAGLSSRMGANKLLADVAGEPLIRRTVASALNSGGAPVVVVTGHQQTEIHEALAGSNVIYVHNPQYSEGLSSSLRVGIAALPTDVEGTIIILGDMPETPPSLLDRMIASFSPEEGRLICVPVNNGRRGNPVLWARQYFPEMERITGDNGAKHLIGVHDSSVFEVEADDTAFRDVDTPEALTALRKRLPSEGKPRE